MKNNILKNYSILLIILYLINNLLLKNIIICGPLYIIIMIVLIITNIIFVIKNKNKIKYKKNTSIILLFISFIGKDILQADLTFTSFIVLAILQLKEKKEFDLVRKIALGMFIIFFYIIIHLIFVVKYIESITNNVMYNKSDNHYYCENNIEILAYENPFKNKVYFATATIKKIIKVDNLITITYQKIEEKNDENLESYIEGYRCKTTKK